ncbi:histidine kinase N-terminal 7TM domain-containing protein [Petroclostridium sp. X23]|uniref:sensor histidine kinase n=1 Tax=Petroclostridium sp. X23 TaxID=3045146 RepID=UPI0024AD34BD|nr:histidine kinase N-terminal 7TM domain-containing protein [Petroclostridium sp. X23]WHH61343.1 histidine kinase N-terminal 7TM domain-containing protein [Petroclostridium sp. X23]
MMQVSDKLAFEIFTIIIFHTIALLILFSFSFYMFLKAKKTPLLYSYLSVVLMIMLWMVSKILKTVAPTQGLRWFFIVTQYFGIDFLGFFLVVFAYIYTKDKMPARNTFILLSVLPILSFLVVPTNPLHMGFYSYYDFYKDRFGPLFYSTQFIHYIYLFTGIYLLSKGFTLQPGFRGKRKWARIFAVLTLMPIIANVYYILFKLNVFPWLFPFPVFDFTPIAASISLILFTIPVLTFRVFDISPISYWKLFDWIPHGIVFLNSDKNLYSGNSSFYSMFLNVTENRDIYSFAKALPFIESEQIQQFLDFLVSDSIPQFEMTLKNNLCYKVTKKILKKNNLLLCFYDISILARNRSELAKQNEELSQINIRLDALAQASRELAIAKTKAQMAQNVHDILGHSLTVVIGTAELAATDSDMDVVGRKLSRINELLISSLNDVKNTFIGKNDWGQTSLIKAILHLKNEAIDVDFVYQGNPYELNSSQTEAVFRLCQEAVTNAIKHGNARTIHIILRYKPHEIDIYTIDNGAGCREIKKSYGLLGIETRINSLSGKVSFGSDGEQGFTIHATLPKVTPQ